MARTIDGRFELLERLGGGGMGLVWRARDQVLHREVALKEVRPSDPDLAEYDPAGARALRERVLREARALARVDHPQVVTIHHIVDEGEHAYPWLVMELVPGGSLQDRLDGGVLVPAEAAALGLGILDGLTAAHAAGIQHRDIKPANILLRADGSPVLTDFGIAFLHDATTLTVAGSVIGTPDFMAPERVAGEEGGPASDLWSLALTLWVAVEGHNPLRRANTLATLAAVLGEQVPAPVHAGPLAAALVSVLVRDPARRPGAEEFRRLLTEALSPGAGSGALGGAGAGAGPGGARSAPPTSYPLSPPAGAGSAAPDAARVAAGPGQAPHSPPPPPYSPPGAAGAPSAGQWPGPGGTASPRGRRGLWWGSGAVAAALAGVLVWTLLPENGTPGGPRSGPSSSADGSGADVPAAELLPKDVRDKGVVEVGSDISYPPMEFRDGAGEVAGIDVDLARALGEELGVEFRFSNIGFDSLLAGVRSGRFDVAMSAMVDTKERQDGKDPGTGRPTGAGHDFVDYFRAGVSVYVRKGDAQGIGGWSGLCGRTVAVQRGTVSEETARSEAAKCGGKKLAIKSFDSDAKVQTALRSGAADAAGAEFPVAAYAAAGSGDGDDFQLVGGQSQVVPYGIAVPQGEKALTAALKAALDAIIEDGTYARILKKWGAADGAVGEAVVNGGK